MEKEKIMPYIKKEQRAIIDEIVDDAKYGLQADGKLNYFLFKLMLRRREIEGESYQFYKNYRAELKECAAEVKRRYMDGYEDEKIKQNGDVK